MQEKITELFIDDEDTVAVLNVYRICDVMNRKGVHQSKFAKKSRANIASRQAHQRCGLQKIRLQP